MYITLAVSELSCTVCLIMGLYETFMCCWGSYSHVMRITNMCFAKFCVMLCRSVTLTASLRELCFMLLKALFGVPWQAAVPWAALQYVTGQINYGGRVTDDNDRVLLTHLLARCYTPEALAPDFTPAQGYPLPAADASLEDCMSHVQGLPAVDTAPVFSMHPNADTTFQLQVKP